jgi:mRNA interferase MazF
MRRGQVWLVEFYPTVGAEIGKRRPAVIINKDSTGILPLRVVVPITQWQDIFAELEWMVSLEPTTENGLIKRSAADAFQIKSVSTDRFLRQIGTLSETEMQAIIKAIALVINIDF